MNRSTAQSLSVACLAAAIAACSGGGSGSTPSSSSASANSPAGPATLSVSLMDAPVDDVTAVNLVITGLSIKPSDGPAFELPLADMPFETDLLTLTDSDPAVLVQNAVIEPGSYEWIRMEVDAEIDNTVVDSYVVTDTGEMQELFVPSGRVQLIGALEIGAAEQLELLFDWDVRSGLVHPPGRGAYHLKPVIRVIGVSYRSKLSGTIALATLQDAANDCNADSPDEMDLGYGNAVYIFEGYDVTPDDVDLVDDVAPIQTVDAEANAAGDYEYSTILGEGLYTVAFTCQAGNDGSETNETGTEPPETDTVAFFATTHNIEVNGSTADLEADF